MKIATSITDLIGNTPLLQVGRFAKQHGLQATLLAKLESFNPAGSAKDRVALSMIEQAEADGLLHPDSTIIEPTSGNTGIGLAMVAVTKGYKVILTMPDTMSKERRDLLAAYGATLVLTDGKLGMNGAIAKAKELANAFGNSFIPSQFENPANPMAHYTTTGPEIWRDTDGKVDIFVAGIGTGGTLSGVGRYLKEQNPNLQVIGVEPADSPLLTAGVAGPHGLQGIGANFVPKTLDTDLYDQVMTVTTKEAYTAAKAFAASEGVLCGISSGAALHAAVQIALDPQNQGKNVVVLLPDTGERYLSTGLFAAQSSEK
ncbi:MAG: cysteine synthase A [Clostridia bacterium]|nr:cysteine synthase A [Clostridia bacterium]